MEEVKFGNNFKDLSVNHGANAGFQFEFFCERCHDAFRSTFTAHTTGRASNWLGRAAGIFGGALGTAGRVAEGMAEAGYGKAHHNAFMAAVAQAEKHFHRCGRCSEYMCDRCWNKEKGLCQKCAPNIAAEVEAAKAQGQTAAAVEKAAEEGRRQAVKVDVKPDRQLVCPKCNAETKGAKFCPECGEKLAVKSACPACNAEIPSGTKFCPECGKKTG